MSKIIGYSAKYSSIVIIIALAAGAPADWKFGGSRTAGLSAGLALPFNVESSGLSNPALYGLREKNFRFSWPSLGYRARGISLQDVRDEAGSIGDGGLDVNDLGGFARRFGDRTKEFGLNGDLGFSFGGVAFELLAQGQATTVPNADLQAWSQSGNDDVGLLIDSDPQFNNAQLDGYGFGFYSFNVAYGSVVQVPGPDRLALGARMKVVRAYYTHDIVNAAQIAGGNPGFSAPEMGSRDVLSKSGVGLDLGALYSTGKNRNVHFAFTVDNAVVPRVSFQGTLTDLVTGRTFGAFPTMFNAGVGYVPTDRLLLAADYIDIGNRDGRQELRIGAEAQLIRGFALRMGLNTRSNATVGVSLFGFNLAYSQALPLQIGSVFRF